MAISIYAKMFRSGIFGARNTDKIINQNDVGRTAADIGQYTNALTAAAKLDNKIGRGAKAAIDAMGKAAAKNTVLQEAGKGAKWAGEHVNPLLIGAAGYRVITAKNKEKALKRELIGMTTMFSFEYLMKEFFNSKIMKNFRAKINNPVLRAAIGILEAATFVTGSVFASTMGYRFSDKFYGDPNEEPKNNKVLTAKDLNKEVKQAKEKLDKLKKLLNTNTTVSTKMSSVTEKPLVG